MKLRGAKLADAEEILGLINTFAEKGLMLQRSRSTIYEHIREFLIIENEENIIAVGSLHIIWGDLAEIRALAVSEQYQRQGLGKRLVEALLGEAKELGCPRIFTLTYQPEFFERCGFKLINKDEMPQKVWKECIHCVKFPNCDENAMILDL